MRILYDSKLLAHKDPFGTLTPGQKCKLSIHIPTAVQATQVVCLVQREDGTPYGEFILKYRMKKGPYELFSGNMGGCGNTANTGNGCGCGGCNHDCCC